MALQNEILVGRFNRALQKMLGIKGGPPTPQLSPEFVPRFAVPTGQEDAYLWGYDLLAAVSLQAGVAAAQSMAQIRNPANSKVAAEIVRISVNETAVDTATRITTGISSADFAVPDSNASFDPRGRRSGNCVVTHMSAGPTVGSVMGTFAIAANVQTELVPANDKTFLPLLPGAVYQVLMLNSNISLAVTWWWRERPLEESEVA
jgi:hypothetical protein